MRRDIGIVTLLALLLAITMQPAHAAQRVDPWLLTSSDATVASTDSIGNATKSPNAIELNATTLSLERNECFQLWIAKVNPSTAQFDFNLVRWSSSNVSVATVSAAGLVTSHAMGSATITCHYAGAGGNKLHPSLYGWFVEYFCVCQKQRYSSRSRPQSRLRTCTARWAS